jgi:hypothetical protein
MSEENVQKRRKAVTDALASVKQEQLNPINARWGGILLAQAVGRIGDAWATDPDGAFVSELAELQRIARALQDVTAGGPQSPLYCVACQTFLNDPCQHGPRLG